MLSFYRDKTYLFPTGYHQVEQIGCQVSAHFVSIANLLFSTPAETGTRETLQFSRETSSINGMRKLCLMSFKGYP